MAKTVKIGVSTSAIGGMRRWKSLSDIIDAGFKRIELYNGQTHLRPSDIPTLKKIIKEKKLDLSMHSASFQLFNPHEIVTKLEELQVQLEVEYCQKLGIRNLVIHMSSDYALTDLQINKLKNIVRKAAKLGVEILLENNFKGRNSSLSDLRKIFKQIPDLRACFDYGHWKVAHKAGQMPALLETIKNYPAEIAEWHIHDNDGKLDYHRRFDSLPNQLLRALHTTKEDKLDIIIEPRSTEDAIASKKIIKRILDHFNFEE